MAGGTGLVLPLLAFVSTCGGDEGAPAAESEPVWWTAA
jgi:hypothetical protein